jgi:glycosyltransferase involved in cell wall biosynthesis
MLMPPTSDLSLVVPAHDEVDNLERVVVEVRAALDPTGLHWELVIVDDGSTDGSAALLDRLAASERLDA